MDRLEEQTKKCLETLGLGTVVHEPNGTMTFPDFMVGGNLLFEVTRLETPMPAKGKVVGHTELFAPLAQTISNIFDLMDLKAKCGREVFVSLNVVLPVDSRILRNSLQNVLKAVSEDANKFTAGRVEVCKGLSLRVYLGEEKSKPKVSLGSLVPSDLSTWVVSEAIKQIKFAAEKKTAKLESYKGEFSEAWLVVGGGAVLGLSNYSFDGIVEELGVLGPWTGLVILNSDIPSLSKRIWFS